MIRDAQGRVYPSPAKRLAPDFAFHPQVYRADGETVRLAAGRLRRRGHARPGVRRRSGSASRSAASRATAERSRSKRWIDLPARGWYSGDHHIHAAGCLHYETPTEGVEPRDMIRHILGEDLERRLGADLGAVLLLPEAVLRGRAITRSRRRDT